MNLNLGFQHQVNVSQQLSLAPQLLQWLRILQIPTTELSQMVQRELKTNPALELEGPDGAAGTDPAAESEAADTERELDLSDERLTEKYQALAELDTDWNSDSLAGGRQSTAASEQDAQERYQYRFDTIASDESLREHLLRQLALTTLTESDLHLGELVVGSLDDRGYLATPLEELAELAGESVAALEKALSAVQAIAPPGVGARDLRECLLLQMRDEAEDFLPRMIVHDYLDALGRGQHREIAASLHVTEDDVLRALKFIRTLRPCPAEGFGASVVQYIEPDVTIRKHDCSYTIDVKDDRIPRLRLSSSCKRLLAKGALQPHELAYIRERLRSAAFLIQGITQRQQTLKRVTEQILLAQSDYLDKPDGRLKPLTMARVASIIGVHETTVSRALANKHIDTPRGLFEMRHFFRNGYRCADGSAFTPEAVKEMVATLIDSEDPRAPLRDVDISAALKKRGLTIARRTVAKYREEMAIPTSKERKRVLSISPGDARAAAAA